MAQGKVLLKVWVLLWITSLAAAHLHYVRSHFTHLRNEDTARQRTVRGREEYDPTCWILDGKVRGDKVRGNCTVPVQCPAHVNKREGEKTTVCVLASGSVGVCCASGFNHTAVPRKKSNTNNPLARNLVQEVLSRAQQEVEHLFQHQKYLLESGQLNVLELGTPSFSHLKSVRQFANMGLDLLNQALQETVATRILRDIAREGLVDKELGLELVENGDQMFPCPENPDCPESKYRSLDGTCNNPTHPLRGAAQSPMHRLLLPNYADGTWSLRVSVIDQQPLPSARLITNTVFTERNVPHSSINILFMQFGQFIVHDISLSPSITHSNGSGISCCTPNGSDMLSEDLKHFACIPIAIPSNDQFFKQFAQRCLNLVRTMLAPRPDCSMGYAVQMNAVSHFLDGSTIYGLTPDANLDLRTSIGGRLRVFHDFGRDLLPLTQDKETCISSEQGSACFLAGDSRVDQTVTLVAVHTLFMREHNRLAEELAILNSHWSDETLFEETRAIVIAELQHIFYTEWLPLLIGEHALDDFDLRDSDVRSVYEPTVSPSTTNEFSTSAFRYGHSTVEGTLRIRKNKVLDEVIKIPDLMFNPSKMRLKDFFDNLLQMMTTQPMQNVDSSFTDALTKFLFRAGNPFGADLVSINIQRGRDHGLRSYNDYRELVGLHRARTFRDFEDIMPPQAISRLEDVYSSPDDVDLYVGGLLEHHSPDAIVGPTFLSIIADQFSRLKKGDRFFYSHKGEPHSFTSEQLHELKKATMARIICDNSDKIQLKVQSPNAFLTSDQSGNDPLSCNHPSIRRMKLKFWKE
uniref:Peroxinectin n=1 Tax=Timema genevievae TaxID=629358 RepID=A0A7R9K565_TIMGE|nr:unnamed protein product [Timema genevievae]